jgi:hypothetical protein
MIQIYQQPHVAENQELCCYVEKRGRERMLRNHKISRKPPTLNRLLSALKKVKLLKPLELRYAKKKKFG